MNNETTWSNIRNLTKIQLKQYRILIYSIMAISTLYPVWNVWSSVTATLSGETVPWRIHSLDTSMNALFILGIVLMICSYNILSKDEISMFPGTVKSRYYSTLLAHHILILIFVLASIWIYLMQVLSLWAFCHFYEGIIPGSLFNLHYFGYGVIRYMGLLLAVYGISSLLFILLERFRPMIVYGTILVCGIFVSYLSYTGYIKGFVQEMIDLFTGEGYSFGMLIIFLVLIWAVCLLLSLGVVRTVKAWGRSDRKRLSITVMVLCVALCMFVIFGAVSSVVDGYDYTFDLAQFEQITDHRIETTVDVSELSEEERLNLDFYRMQWKYPVDTDEKEYSAEDRTNDIEYFSEGVFGSLACSASQAKEYGLTFDESRLDQDHVIMLLGSQSLTYTGKDLGENLLKACRDSVALVKTSYEEKYQDEMSEDDIDLGYLYQIEIPAKPMIVLNESYGNLKPYMKNTTLGRYEHFSTGYGGTEALLRVIIYPDEWNMDID